MTRILHVLNGSGGGATLSTIELARSLGCRGFEPHAVAHAGHGTLDERSAVLDAFGGRVTFLPLYFWNRRVRTAAPKRVLVVARQEVLTAHGLRSAARVRELAVERRIDLVHTGIAIVPDGAVAARSLGLPHVLHVRELLGPDQPFRIFGEGPRLARVLGGPRQRIVANSANTGRLTAAVVPGVDIDVIPNGLDLGRFDAIAEGHDDARPVMVVAMVANLISTVKRHDLFVDAAAIVARRHPDIEFRIYGHRDSRASSAYIDDLVQRAAAEGLTSKLVLAGFVADPAQMMREIDLLVQPTSAESFGRVVVEAMASNVGVVGVAEGPLGELIEHEQSGLLAPASTPEALAAAVLRFIDDRELRATAVARARVRAHDLFSVEHCAERMAGVYDDLLRVGRGPGQPLARSWARYTAGRFIR